MARRRSNRQLRQVPKDIEQTSRREAEGIVVFPDRPADWPIGDLYHARLALIYVLSGSHKKARSAVVKAVAKHYPEYNWAAWWDPKAVRHELPTWSSLLSRRNPMARRRRTNPTRRTRRNRKPYVLLENRKPYVLLNPQGLRIGKGNLVLSGKGSKTHVYDPDTGGTLCDSNASVRPSSSKTVYCYRCIKLMNMNQGNIVRRDIARSKRPDVDNYMIPGGSEGAFVGGSDFGPYGMAGDPNFPLNLPAPHPTQTREMSARSRAGRLGAQTALARREARKRAGRQVANPRKRLGRARAQAVMSLVEYRAGDQKAYERGINAGLADAEAGLPRRKHRKSASAPYRRGYKVGYEGSAQLMAQHNPRKMRGRKAAQQMYGRRQRSQADLRPAELAAYDRGFAAGMEDGEKRETRKIDKRTPHYQQGYAEGYQLGLSDARMAFNPRRRRKNRGSRRRR